MSSTSVQHFRSKSSAPPFLADKTQIYPTSCCRCWTRLRRRNHAGGRLCRGGSAPGARLLERLLAAVDEAALAQSAQSPETGERLTALRRRLAWLTTSCWGTTRQCGLDGAITDGSGAAEASLQRLEWRVATMAGRGTCHLDTVQQALAQDEQAVSITRPVPIDGLRGRRATTHTWRFICAIARAVEQALVILRFHNAEIGDDYLAR